MILVDPRYGGRGVQSHRAVVKALQKLEVEIEESPLSYGDFLLMGEGPDGPLPIGIELKTISDFVSSMRSGRLCEQAAGMVETYGRSYLILEGTYRAHIGSGVLEIPRGRRWRPVLAGPRPIFWTDVGRFITGLEEMGVRFRYSRTCHQSAYIIASVLAGFWSKPYAHHQSTMRGGYRPVAPMSLVHEDPVERQARMFACCLPGIGWGRSKAVIAAFKSIEGLLLATREEWAAIPGIGKTIANSVYEAIRATVPQSRLHAAHRVPARVQTSVRGV